MQYLTVAIFSLVLWGGVASLVTAQENEDAVSSSMHEHYPNAEFGKYGYKHGLLHRHGTIDELMEQTGKSCCDGGMGGECRATQIWRQLPVSFFKYGEYWCPLDSYTEVHNLGTLPMSISAIVCAGHDVGLVPKEDPYGNMQYCPSTYCAGSAIEG